MAESLAPAYVGYRPGEIDTIIVKRFPKGGNFSQAMDSIVLTPANSVWYTTGDTNRISSMDQNFAIKENYDWQVLNTYDNRSLQISEIKVNIVEQNCGGLFSWDPGGCVSPVASLRLNGVATTLDQSLPFRTVIIKK